jgi:nickel/cobalt transporter (NicO) family protein
MKFLACLMLLFFIILPISSQENPFVSSEAPRQEETERIKSAPASGGGRLFPKLAAVQKKLNESISKAVYEIQETPSAGIILSVLGVSFLYGFIHALGPGHRKIILSSYFLSERIRPLSGILIAFSVAMLHGIAALALISILFFVLHTAVSISFNATYLLVERVSYGIIVLLGTYLIVHAVRERRKQSENPRTQSGKKRIAERIIFIVSNGAVPCPGAAMLLVFTFAYGLYALGIFAILAMSVGMGFLLSLIAAAVLLGKEQGLQRLFLGTKGKTALLILELTGSAAVLAFGAVLFLGSF